jgi:hypothetical protein
MRLVNGVEVELKLMFSRCHDPSLWIPITDQSENLRQSIVAIATPSPAAVPDLSPSSPARNRRITSIDALRGLVIFTMIFVNDIAGVSKDIVPGWMRHFKANGNGMTFVDLVFPAVLFIVGMSIPSPAND